MISYPNSTTQHRGSPCYDANRGSYFAFISYWSYATQSNTPPSNTLSATGTNNANYEPTGNLFTAIYTDPVNFYTVVGAFPASPSAYGTYDQCGDVSQWDEGRNGFNRYERGAIGGPFGNLDSTHRQTSFVLSASPPPAGFRVASVAAVPNPRRWCWPAADWQSSRMRRAPSQPIFRSLPVAQKSSV